ncbi:hypothetical protein PVAP13_8NG220212 [Panicum virgatum]|uniref:Uncharacterized protein n=1 Tax=Panicum virgatum TaxID=38727 RepID=A0A8T0P611_PANVG|nr:hypothetical protein PVAP13_8NG220212 [Panicum virgatum]
MTRDNFTYLCIQEGPQTHLVLAWSPSVHVRNFWMRSVRALERYVTVCDTKFFKLVKSVVKMPYYDDTNQYSRACN